jgi:hypothetical protein
MIPAANPSPNVRLGAGADTDFPDLDPGIRQAVRILREAGVETFESCEGGERHAYPEPTVRCAVVPQRQLHFCAA